MRRTVFVLPRDDSAVAIPELTIKLAQAIGKPYEGTVGLSSKVLILLALEGHLGRGRPPLARPLRPGACSRRLL